MSARDVLERHAGELHEETGLSVDVVEGDANRIFVMIREVPLPQGLFRVAASDVLFLADSQYPLSALDMFWTDVSVVRADGTVPQGAEQIENYMNRQWRRFSWHRNGLWNPTSNGLLDHFYFMESRWGVEVRV